MAADLLQWAPALIKYIQENGQTSLISQYSLLIIKRPLNMLFQED